MTRRSIRFRYLVTILSFFFSAAFIVQCNNSQPETQNEQQITKAKEDTPELADAMGQLQQYLHKYSLAVEAENYKLAAFYFHEVEAAADGIKKDIPGYEGYNIKQFMEIMFDPTLESVEIALTNKDWDEVRTETINLVDACNSCHNATAHGFVQVTPGFDNNPFNQDFSGTN